MVNKSAVVRWNFISSITQKQAIICFGFYLIVCVFSSLTTLSISFVDVLISLFDGYKSNRLNVPEFLKYIMLRLTPIYLIAFTFSPAIERDSYFRIRLYKCSEWKKAIEYAALFIELLFTILQVVVASLTYFLAPELQEQGVVLYGDSLIVLLLPVTTFLEIYMSILFFFNAYFLSRNSVFSFLLLFFLYLFSAMWSIPIYPFGLSSWRKIQCFTSNLTISFICVTLVFVVAILILHQFLRLSVKKFLLR